MYQHLESERKNHTSEMLNAWNNNEIQLMNNAQFVVPHNFEICLG